MLERMGWQRVAVTFTVKSGEEIPEPKDIKNETKLIIYKRVTVSTEFGPSNAN